MQLAIMASAALGFAAFAYVGAPGTLPSAGGADSLVGARLYASEAPIPRWGDPVLAEELPIEDLGTVTAVEMGPDGEPRGLVVAVGGLWGYGARSVELGLDRVRLVGSREGAERLVVDLSAGGADPESL